MPVLARGSANYNWAKIASGLCQLVLIGTTVNKPFDLFHNSNCHVSNIPQQTMFIFHVKPINLSITNHIHMKYKQLQD